mmetsp:Transcript_69869/g.164397  ORF Transcript_69869/g.164397 Transcript_69869/m.164397 type:complete len:257 (+) Transcript_69869:392-1162(+)
MAVPVERKRRVRAQVVAADSSLSRAPATCSQSAAGRSAARSAWPSAATVATESRPARSARRWSGRREARCRVAPSCTARTSRCLVSLRRSAAAGDPTDSARASDSGGPTLSSLSAAGSGALLSVVAGSAGGGCVSVGGGASAVDWVCETARGEELTRRRVAWEVLSKVSLVTSHSINHSSAEKTPPPDDSNSSNMVTPSFVTADTCCCIQDARRSASCGSTNPTTLCSCTTRLTKNRRADCPVVQSQSKSTPESSA